MKILGVTSLFMLLTTLLSCVPAAQPAPLPPSTPASTVNLPPPELEITSPATGINITAGAVSISVAITDFKLAAPGGNNIPGKGHILYYLDTDIPTTPGKPAITETSHYQSSSNITATWDNVLPGTRTFGAQLVNNDQTPLTPPVTATVTVNVMAGMLKVVGHLDFGVGPGYTTDVWAHTAASGRSYAYLGSYDEPRCGADITGVNIVDITDPASPVKVGFVPSPAGTRANDIAVERIKTPSFDGDILIHTVENCRNSEVAPGGSGIILYDVTDPLSPGFLAGNFLNFEVHNVFIYQQGDRAFVLVVQDEGERDFHIVEITNPREPREVSARGAVDWFDPATDEMSLGEMPTSFLHGVWARVYPDDFPDSRLAGKTIAYLSYWDAGLILLDITDPANPIFLGDSDYLNPDPLSGQPPEGNSHSAMATADGKLVVMADEDFSPTRTVFSVDSGNFTGEYRAAGATFTVSVEDLPGKKLSGPAVFVGPACDAADIPPASTAGLQEGEKPIALIERGVCPFDTKIANVAAAGYGGAVVFGNLDAPDELIQMGGDDTKGTIPAVFVARATALAILGISPDVPLDTALPTVGTVGNRITINAGVFDGWGYMRILDVSDPANIKELGQYATAGAFTNPVSEGDHSIHDPWVDSQRAYISWYWDGIRVVDFSDPAKPVEVAFFIDETGHSNFWGVYLYQHPNGNTYILGSDRDSGLWILKAPEAGLTLATAPNSPTETGTSGATYDQSGCAPAKEILKLR